MPTHLFARAAPRGSRAGPGGGPGAGSPPTARWALAHDEGGEKDGGLANLAGSRGVADCVGSVTTRLSYLRMNFRKFDRSYFCAFAEHLLDPPTWLTPLHPQPSQTGAVHLEL